ncbi:hypothetical protein BGZ46_010464 [Entomortierella lignicola]|nr:hypothetical protein BGZ46_010464 [Entomortierella lignicola]
MFSSIVGRLHKPRIAIRVKNDDSTFNPKDYPNIVFTVKGKAQGLVKLVHGSEDDNSGLAIVSSRIWVTKEGDKDQVSIHTAYDNRTLYITLEGPTRFSSYEMYHETSIVIPRSIGHMENLTIISPNTSLVSERLDYISWNAVKAELTSSHLIGLQSIHADSIDFTTTNSKITGVYKAGHVNLKTCNSSISAKITMQRPMDGRQSTLTTKTTNSNIILHVDASSASTGLNTENTSSNGKIIIGALLGSASLGSKISTVTSNGKIELNLDASQTGQSLEVHQKTSNASIVSSIMDPRYQPFKARSESSNGSVTMNLTEEYLGQFDLSTSNANVVVEGTHLYFDEDARKCKRGTRGARETGLGDVKLSSNNAGVSLRFYPAGESLVSKLKGQF